MPPDGVLMVSAVDIFKTSGAAGGVPPVHLRDGGPRAAVSAVIGLDDDGRFWISKGSSPTEGPARHWEAEWPTIRRKLGGNPLVLLGGFSPLVAHATLTRDGQHDPRARRRDA